MDRIDDNQEEKFERDKLPPLTQAHFDEDEEFKHEEQITPENYKEEKQVSHFTLDSRQFIIELLTNLSDIAVVPFSDDSWEEIWSRERSLTLFNLKPQYYPKGDLIPKISKFVSKIVHAGGGSKALEHLDREILNYTRQIEEHPKAGRIITPVVFETDEDMLNFWFDKFIGECSKEEQIRESKQRLEIQRLNLSRMRLIHKELFVKQEQYERSKHSNRECEVNSDINDLGDKITSQVSVADSSIGTASNTRKDKPEPKTPKKNQKEYNFYTVFRDEAKAHRLVGVLTAKRFIDSSKKWLLKDTDIILLTRILAKNVLLVKEDNKALLFRILCKEFGIDLNPLPFNESMLYKLKGKKELKDEFTYIITNL